MNLVTQLSHLSPALRHAVVALGNFDGVHKGHQVVLAAAQKAARRINRPFGVLTFEPHPRQLLCPESRTFRITPFAVKRRLLGHIGADVLFEIPFTPDFMKVTAQDFIEKILCEKLGIAGAVAGYDFVFGHKRGGDMNFLKQRLAAHHIPVTAIEPVNDSDNNPWSSTRIRADLEKGDVQAAAAALGRLWEIEGAVEKGAQRGAALGFPTANLALGDFQRPRFGVYAVQVFCAGGVHKGVANIGLRPTVDGTRESLEVHIFDFSDDLYGKNLRVGLKAFIRDEQAFPDFQALKTQIAKDCAAARNLLDNQA